MKTVLLLVPSLGIGGQEKIAINTVRCLEEKYNVKMIIFQKKKVEYEYPCEVINLEIPTRNGVFKKILNQCRRISGIIKIRKKNRAYAVISFGKTANITNVISGIFSPGKSISAVHGFAEVKKDLIMRIIMRLSNRVICISKSMQEKLLSLFPTSKNTIVIENGYDVNNICENLKETVEVNVLHPLIVSMGRLEEVKGFDRLIKAFAIAHKERTDINLMIIGQGSLFEKLQDLSISEGVQDSVHFMGYQSNPHKFLKQSDIYVLSSRNEGFPNALIEALCCELPIIALDCQSGPREILSEHYTSSRTVGIVEEKYGVLVEESSSEDLIIHYLAQAILSLLNDTEKMQIYRNLSIGRANQFNNDVYKEKIISLIEE
ncbi:MAG: glycosyltransferase [Ruminococcaceae bacterium]|nr:glycosyltransferase [Oscillospiraceae bacterium]